MTEREYKVLEQLLESRTKLLELAEEEVARLKLRVQRQSEIIERLDKKTQSYSRIIDRQTKLLSGQQSESTH